MYDKKWDTTTTSKTNATLTKIVKIMIIQDKVSQPQIHTGFHHCMEIGHIF